ncbi:hypothetical protein AHAS_Ahas09G0069200 [Arachis hypogaea]
MSSGRLMWHFDLKKFRTNEVKRVKISLACVFAFMAIGWPLIIYKTGIMRWIKFWSFPNISWAILDERSWTTGTSLPCSMYLRSWTTGTSLSSSMYLRTEELTSDCVKVKEFNDALQIDLSKQIELSVNFKKVIF